MRWIYISPHLDDAVLSAGGLIHDQARSGIPVEIWTFMCGDPHETELSMFAQVLHYQWGFASAEETIRLRRIEDQRAAEILGAKTVHFDFLDCIYRRGRNGDWNYTSVFVPPHEDDADLPRQIAETIAPRLTRDDVLVCQLGLGSHVDHVLVRRGVEMLGHPLVHDADIPYLFQHPDSLASSTAGMKESLHAVTEAGLRSWQEAVNAYASQLSTLMDTPEQLHESIRGYWAEQGGIRLWSPA
jgi:LmbE family N-acetylglucosaminyl deacetylase